MVKSIFKRSVALIMTLAVSLGFLFSPQPIESQAKDLSADIVSIAFPRQNDVTTKGTDTWGHKRLVYANGSVHEANQYTNMQFIEKNNNSICYCIEPGEHVSDGSSYTQRGEEYFNKIPNNRLLERDEIKEALGRIFQYGYIGTVSDSWVSQNSSDADKIAHAMATQFLIWEVIVGERDKDFNHVNAPGGYNNVLEGLGSKHPLKSKVMDHYNKIVSSIQNHVGKPSFMAEKEEEAITVELKWNGSNYSGTLTDTNNVLSNFTFVPSNTNVKVSINSNKLTITSYKYVSNVSITAIKKASTKRSGIVVWEAPTNEQTVATYGAQVSDPIQAYINVTVNTGMIYGYKTTLNDSGTAIGLSGAKMGLFSHNETIFTEETALQTCISGQTIPGTTTFHPGGYYFTNVKHGTYLIKEIEAPNGYVLSNETRTVTLNSDRAMVSTSIVNEKINGKIIGYKLDPNDRPLAGAKIGLYKRPPHEQFDSTPINVYVTGNDGYFEFNNLPAGMYYIQEIEAPLGYVLSEAVYPRRVVNNTPIEIKIYNDLFYEEIQGIKVDNNGLPLEGALIGIFKLGTAEFAEAKALASVVTDENGYFEFTNLTRGLYIVKEISPAPGYVLSTQQCNVRILDENKIIIDGVLYEGENATASISIKIVNEPIKIIGTKLDSNREPLAGAVIGLFAYTQTEYTKENALQISTSDSDGSFLFSTLPRGIYRIKELSAPNGYEINNNVYILIVTNDGKYSIRNESKEILESLEIINNPIPHIISVTKLDTLGNSLSGAEFLLEWSNDGVNYLPVVTTASYDAAVGCTTTLVVDGKACVSESGTLTFEGLCPNLYYRLTETKAPNGYNLLKEAAFEGFVSINDNISVELDVINTQTFILPPTGGYANYVVPIGMIASVSIASVAIYLIKTNRKERKK